MSGGPRGRSVGVALAVAAVRAAAAWGQQGPATNEWAEAGAVFRLALRRAEGSPWPATCGEVTFGTGSLDPLQCPVSVRRSDGAAAGSMVVWGAAGDPLTLLFDTTSGPTGYVVFVGGRMQAAPPAWKPDAGVLLECRSSDRPDIPSADEFRRRWGAAREVQGRTLVPRIFHGLNPLGPNENYLARYAGFLRVEKPGRYGFATASDDASFLLIDGKRVAQWPGIHSAEEGRTGKYGGEANLAAGAHTIEYLHSQGTADSFAMAAWRPPGTKGFTVIPDSAYAPVARFVVGGASVSPRARGAVAFDATMVRHLMTERRAVVLAEFAVHTAEEGVEYRWSFDDGGQARGTPARHWFPRPGLRTVRLQGFRGGRTVVQAQQRVRVHPLWGEEKRWPEGLFERTRGDWLARDFSSLPLEDLLYFCRWAVEASDEALLAHVGAAVVARAAELTVGDLDLLWHAAVAARHPAVRAYGGAEAALRALLGRADADPGLAARGRMELASFLFEVRGRDRQAEELLAGIPAGGLAGDDERRRRLLLADLKLAGRDIEGSRRGYQALTADASLRDRRTVVQRRARLEYAGDLLRRQEWDAAAVVLEQIEWEQPMERLSPETGLAMVRAMLGRKEYERALQRCRLLLNVAVTDDEQAETLFRTAEVLMAMGRESEAREVVRRLRKDHAYSEAAARAQDRWPGLSNGSP